MTLKNYKFNVTCKEKYSRTGLIDTHRGYINTPAFMPVGTQATVKATFIEDIKKTGSQIILGNSYHLMIRPGINRIKSAGGLHEFMNCSLPILTDSGGFQVMSLSKFNKIDREKGAIFQSHIDGKEITLSPEESIRIQKELNSDIVMVMDECPKKTNDYKVIEKSMELSTYWAERSKKAFGSNPHKAIFGIVQGGLFKDLRIKSLEKLIKIDFDGYAIGGLAVGETQEEMFTILDDLKEHMPENVEKMLKIFHNLARFIAKFPIPVVSLIEGQCLGAGFEIALCSHLVFATPNSIIACPEIKLGVFPPILASLGDHKLGNSLTLKLMLTGCNISIKEALICGFINEVFTNGKADIMLINWFKKNLQQLSAFSLRQSIKALHHNSKTIKCLKYNLNKIEKQYLEELMAGYDGKEGISSFIEKRNPIWHNC